MRRMFLLVALALGAGCSSSESVRPRSPGVELTVSVAPSVADPGGALEITAQAVHRGQEMRLRREGCSYWGQGMSLALSDPSGRPVHLWNPLIRPACPDGEIAFRAGDRADALARFDGNLYTDRGELVTAPSGTYTAVVEFSTRLAADPGVVTAITRSITFEWPSP